MDDYLKDKECGFPKLRYFSPDFFGVKVFLPFYMMLQVMFVAKISSTKFAVKGFVDQFIIIFVVFGIFMTGF